jgi:hypothetical protein
MDRGDLAISGNMSSGVLGNVSAYAFIDNFAALVEASHDPRFDDHDDHRYINANALLGYCRPAGERFKAEVYLGCGFGSADATEREDLLFSDSYETRRRAQFTNLLCQVDLGVMHESAEAAFQVRGSYVIFNNFQRIEQELSPEGNVRSFEVVNGHRNELFLENSFLLRFGSDHFKVLGFANLSIKVRQDVGEDLIYTPFTVGVGLHYRLNTTK